MDLHFISFKTLCKPRLNQSFLTLLKFCCFYWFRTMSLYPTLEELADVNIDYFMEDKESVMFRRTNGKIGVCA